MHERVKWLIIGAITIIMIIMIIIIAIFIFVITIFDWGKLEGNLPIMLL